MKPCANPCLPPGHPMPWGSGHDWNRQRRQLNHNPETNEHKNSCSNRQASVPYLLLQRWVDDHHGRGSSRWRFLFYVLALGKP